MSSHVFCNRIVRRFFFFLIRFFFLFSSYGPLINVMNRARCGVCTWGVRPRVMYPAHARDGEGRVGEGGLTIARVKGDFTSTVNVRIRSRLLLLIMIRRRLNGPLNRRSENGEL